MRFLRQSLAGLFFTALAVGLLAYAGQMVFLAVEAYLNEDPRQRPAREREFSVHVVTASLSEEHPELVAYGRVQSRRRLELRVPVGGRVVSLSEAFVEGGSVAANEVLVELDPADARASLSSAIADQMDAAAEARDANRALSLARDELAAAMEQADLRTRAFQRQLDLQSRGVGTAAAVEEAELIAAQARQSVITRRQALSQAEARVDQAATRQSRAETDVDIARRDLADMTVVAEFAGTLEQVSLVKGRLVSANEKLADLVDPSQLEVAFRVSTVQYARLLDENGRLQPLPVTARLDATGADLEAQGVISRDSGAAGGGQSGRLIYARLDRATGIKPNDFVTVTVQEPAINGVVRVAASAYGSDGAVLVLGEDSRLEVLKVELLRRQGDDVLIRGAGLVGREIVTGRTPLLGAGIRVTPLRPEAAAPAAPELIELSADRRARLVSFVEGNSRMPDAAKKQMLGQLEQTQVPAALVNRIESRMGG